MIVVTNRQTDRERHRKRERQREIGEVFKEITTKFSNLTKSTSLQIQEIE